MRTIIVIAWLVLGFGSLFGLRWTTPAEHGREFFSQEFWKEFFAVGFEVFLAGFVMERLLRFQDRRAHEREKRLELARALQPVIDDLKRGKFLMEIHRSYRTWKEQVILAGQSKTDLDAIISKLEGLKNVANIAPELRKVTSELDRLQQEYKEKRLAIGNIQKRHEALPDKDSENALDENWTKILEELNVLKDVWVKPSEGSGILNQLQCQQDKLNPDFKQLPAPRLSAA